jgi:pseudouridine-5'-phosphate glycosidase/pseudouridine kinase
VCAGVKSILDIGRTLEVLETQGVGVYTVGPSDEFPAFYSASSGHRSMAAVTEAQAAEIIAVHTQCQIASGCLFAVPIPPEHDLGAAIARDIDAAVADAMAANVRGKDVTPFVLQRVGERSGMQSLTANIALVKNNARTAARLARHVSGGALQRAPAQRRHLHSDTTAGRVVVAGGATRDVIMRLDTELQPRTTAYGQLHEAHGGVGRNVVESAARCGARASFVTVLGDDMIAEAVKAKLTALGVDLHVIAASNTATPTYNAWLSPDGALISAVADMRAFLKLTTCSVWTALQKLDLGANDVVVLDSNIVPGTEPATLMELARRVQLTGAYGEEKGGLDHRLRCETLNI